MNSNKSDNYCNLLTIFLVVEAIKEGGLLKFMKSAEEIIVRAILLVCLSDRAALEKSTIEGVAYTLKQREEQRKAIYQWIVEQGYYESLVLEEKTVFEQEVGRGDTIEVLSKQLQYEGIEPLLWSLGFIDQLSSYNEFVVEDFHYVLEIEKNHSFEKILAKSNLRECEAVHLQSEIAMLWHWRAKESNNPIFSNRPISEVIVATFGEDYVKLLSQMNLIEDEKKDFLVNKKAFERLTVEEKARIQLIAYWRQYAFEWIFSKDAWGDIELTT